MKQKMKKKVFGWKPGTIFAQKLKAQVVGEEIDRLLEEHGQKLKARNVVDVARDPKNPLHPAFEWDEGRAAEEYRLYQARTLLRSVSVTIITPAGGEHVTRAVVRTDDGAGTRRHNYTSTEYALADEELRAQLLRTALLEFAALKRRYVELSELAEIFAAIDRTAKKVA